MPSLGPTSAANIQNTSARPRLMRRRSHLWGWRRRSEAAVARAPAPSPGKGAPGLLSSWRHESHAEKPSWMALFPFGKAKTGLFEIYFRKFSVVVINKYFGFL